MRPLHFYVLEHRLTCRCLATLCNLLIRALHRRMAPPPSANSAASSGASSGGGESARPAGQKRAGPDERRQKQPEKRHKHHPVTVSAEDFMMPNILQPIQTALAQETDKFRAECEQLDPPNFEEDATEHDKPIDKPILRLGNVYARLKSIQAPGCLSTSTPAQKNAMYLLIKGLLALFHSDVDSSACRSSPKKESAVDLWRAFCSHDMRPLAFEASSLELLALAVRQQIVADRMDRPRHIPRYLKYFADFAERALCSSLIVRTTSASQCTTAAAGNH